LTALNSEIEIVGTAKHITKGNIDKLVGGRYPRRVSSSDEP